jgi:hypothetical protein
MISVLSIGVIMAAYFGDQTVTAEELTRSVT